MYDQVCSPPVEPDIQDCPPEEEAEEEDHGCLYSPQEQPQQMDHNEDHPPQEEPEEEDQGSNYSPREQPQQESVTESNTLGNLIQEEEEDDLVLVLDSEEEESEEPTLKELRADHVNYVNFGDLDLLVRPVVGDGGCFYR